eukprot:TRINITY_DN13311_c0_g1_i1.p1 TRINITY_DN13311_c0_g1~~TRINITY_DN13311_c0_g1_i1.p1  ORF type:complete len:598 (+),score=98.46 TRINITY_DN13311_c0_g1_i1:111-1796(+)
MRKLRSLAIVDGFIGFTLAIVAAVLLFGPCTSLNVLSGVTLILVLIIRTMFVILLAPCGRRTRADHSAEDVAVLSSQIFPVADDVVNVGEEVETTSLPLQLANANAEIHELTLQLEKARQELQEIQLRETKFQQTRRARNLRLFRLSVRLTLAKRKMQPMVAIEVDTSPGETNLVMSSGRAAQQDASSQTDVAVDIPATTPDIQTACHDFDSSGLGVDYLSVKRGDMVVILKREGDPEQADSWLYGLVNGCGPGWFRQSCLGSRVVVSSSIQDNANNPPEGFGLAKCSSSKCEDSQQVDAPTAAAPASASSRLVELAKEDSSIREELLKRLRASAAGDGAAHSSESRATTPNLAQVASPSASPKDPNSASQASVAQIMSKVAALKQSHAEQRAAAESRDALLREELTTQQRLSTEERERLQKAVIQSSAERDVLQQQCATANAEAAEARRIAEERIRNGISVSVTSGPELSVEWDEAMNLLDPGMTTASEGARKLKASLAGRDARLRVGPPPPDWRALLRLTLQQGLLEQPSFLRLHVRNAGVRGDFMGFLWSSAAVAASS